MYLYYLPNALDFMNSYVIYGMVHTEHILAMYTMIK